VSDEQILVERRGTAAWLYFNRPAALNALTPQLIDELEAALIAAEADDAVRVVVLSGKGAAFCAGADLKYVKSSRFAAAKDPALAFLRHGMTVMKRLENLPKPVIAAVNGLALAGGFEFVLCCDVVIAAEDAMLGDAHANYGIIPGGGSSVRLPRRIGANHAKYMIFTGDFLPAGHPKLGNLMHAVTPADELTATVDGLAEKLATKSPLGLRRMKELVNDSWDQPLDSALRLELLALEVHSRSHDMLEGLAAFTERRQPKFNGT